MTLWNRKTRTLALPVFMISGLACATTTVEETGPRDFDMPQVSMERTGAPPAPDGLQGIASSGKKAVGAAESIEGMARTGIDAVTQPEEAVRALGNGALDYGKSIRGIFRIR